MSEDKVDKIRLEIDAALSDIFSRHESSMVTKWVVTIESMEPDSDRYMSLLASPGAKVWDTIGLLNYALQIEGASIMKGKLDE